MKDETTNDNNSRAFPRPALQRLIGHLWADELAHYAETSPREGRDGHVFLAVLELHNWLTGADTVPEDYLHPRDWDTNAGKEA